MRAELAFLLRLATKGSSCLSGAGACHAAVPEGVHAKANRMGRRCRSYS